MHGTRPVQDIRRQRPECGAAVAEAAGGKSLELEQPQYFVDGRGTLQAKKGR